jgi:hypothetical protein
MLLYKLVCESVAIETSLLIYKSPLAAGERSSLPVCIQSIFIESTEVDF